MDPTEPGTAAALPDPALVVLIEPARRVLSAPAMAVRIEETGYTFDAVRAAVPELRVMVRRGNEEGP